MKRNAVDRNADSLSSDRLYMMLSTLGALLFAFALSVSMNVQKGELERSTGVFSQICFNLYKSINGREGQATILFFGLMALQKKLRLNMFRSNGPLLVAFNVFIAIIWTCAEGFRIDNTVSVLMQTAGQRTKTFLYLLGCVYGINLLCALFLRLTNAGSEFSEISKKTHGSGHITIKAAILLAVLWLPHVLISYPASGISDAYYQLAQFFGLWTFTAHHPVVHSVLMGTIVKIGSAVNGDFGLFLFVIFQLIVFSLVQGYMFQLMYDLHAPKFLIVTTFVVCIFSPYYGGYIPVLLKDNLYSYCYSLMIIELVYLIKIGPDFFHSARHMCLYALGVCGTWLFRNNGKYIIIVLSFAIMLYVFSILKKSSYKKSKMIKCRCLLMLALPVMLSLLTNHACVKHYNAESGSIREALSLPFQQTARYVKYFGQEVTDDERAAIDGVLDYATLPEKYNPRLSDPVKATYRNNVKLSDLIRYFKVWFIQFTKHPLTYFDATLNQNYYLVYPYIPNSYTLTSMYTSWNICQQVFDYLSITPSPQREQRGEALSDYYNLLFRVPVLCLLIHPAFHTIILFWLMFAAAKERKTAFLLAVIPNFVSIIVVILGPVIQGHPRYMFPVIFTTPLILVLYLYMQNNLKNVNCLSES